MSVNTPIRIDMGARDWVYLIVLSVTWGLSFIFMEVALTDLPVFTIVASRLLIGALVLNIFLALKGRNLLAMRSHWRSLFLMALFGQVIPFCLIVWAQMHITASLASILNSGVPFFTVLVAHMMTSDEKFKAHRALGVVIGMVGVALVIGPQALGTFDQHFLAEMVMVFSAVLYAWVTVYARRFSRKDVAPLSVAGGQLSISALIMIPLVLLIDQPWVLAMPSFATWGSVVGLGAISTGFAFVLYYLLIARVGATNTSLVTLLVPVNTIWIANLFLNESLLFNHVLGMIVIAVGLMAIDGRPFSMLRARFA